MHHLNLANLARKKQQNKGENRLLRFLTEGNATYLVLEFDATLRMW